MTLSRKRPGISAGSALFRGALPPRPENLDAMAKAGVTLSHVHAAEEAHWSMRAMHPKWGHCTLTCLRNPPRVPELLIDHDGRLTDDEKKLARLGHSSVTVRMDAADTDVLRERKHLLRFLHAVSGGDAVAIADHTSQAFWSSAALEEELAHDADLDILALFTAHSITGNDGDGPAHWMHTHGLAELGFFDFDVLDPSPALGEAWDVVRAIAFSVVEGAILVGGADVSLVGGMPPVRMVDARTFLGQCANRYPKWATSVDDEHLDGHAIACDPQSKGFLGLFGAAPRPWSVLAFSSFEDAPILFSDAATDVMAARARATLPIFRALRDELADLELPAIVKLRYEMRVGAGGEHLWFEVHGVTDARVDATLMNEPFGDIGFKAGDRRAHPIDRLSDWSILTPLGQITPRSLGTARALRAKRDEIAAALRERRGGRTG